MAGKNDDFLKKLLTTFRIEADEHLKSISAGLLELEKMPASNRQAEIVENIFRDAHSLKGAARAVSLTDIESVCQSLESVFSALKGKTLASAPPLFDLLYQTIDALNARLTPQAAETGKPGVAALIRRLDDALRGVMPTTGEPPPASPPESTLPPVPLPLDKPAAMTGARISPVVQGLTSETIRVSTAKLDAVMRQTEELLAPRLAAGQRTQDLHETGAVLAAWKKERARIRPAVHAMERSFTRTGRRNGAVKEQHALTKLLEHLDTDNLHLKHIEDRLTRLRKFAERDHRALTEMVDNLLHGVKEMHMLPFSSLTEIFPRFIRELARDQGKQVELTIEGTGIEIDRRILEAMKDPFIHLLRNCVDHGIEKPAARVQKNKPPHGSLRIAVSQKDSGKIEILVADDGAGIDAAQVQAAAQRLGMLSAEEAQRLGEPETIALIFRSGVSTSPIITDLSGRGLGLAIVQERVERVGGAIAFETHPDAGTSFRIVLPLSLATFRGVLIRVGEQRFVIPAISVERVTQVTRKDIQTVENRETIPLGGQAVSLVWLSDVLEMPRNAAANEAADRVPAIVLGSGLAHIAFRVDEILGEQEVLVKNLGRQLARVRNIAGASVLGTGQVAPVLNVSDLMKSAVQFATAPRLLATAGKPAQAQQRSILVVEDSITSRALLKNILESAGFLVSTAVDGMDAYTALKTATFDLVVSDVEMPRMDGFDLTAKIRADKQHSELPVVLVTALESREHRERGIDVGANAYIVKSSFDQSNLLEVIGQLI
ncbi:MAG: hybrid sensor histidine kinase/response regulator [Betaproteobacteria bacterium HGW-Betaproteobacteria-11]|nr:MAG: hybrid sensor histidine kinase/response regulator [Betaproteobacteria bacterium HGW-Betaproteobacteria-11]